MRGHFRHARLLLRLLLLWGWALVVISWHRTGRTVPARLRFGDFVNQRFRATLDEDRNVPHRGLLLWLLLLGHLFLPSFLLMCVNFALPPWSLARRRRCPRVSCFLHQSSTNALTDTRTRAGSHTVDREREGLLSLGCSRKRLLLACSSSSDTHDFALIFGRNNFKATRCWGFFLLLLLVDFRYRNGTVVGRKEVVNS